jgi:PilZ domain-containing protein
VRLSPIIYKWQAILEKEYIKHYGLLLPNQIAATDTVFSIALFDHHHLIYGSINQTYRSAQSTILKSLMQNEKRKHPRLTLGKSTAHITLQPFDHDAIELKGQVLDLSYSGIRISLETPLPKASDGKVKIVITLPESKIPITIHGIIKHRSPDSKYGLEYANDISEDQLDLMLFECIKLSKTHLNENSSLPT